MYRRIVVALDGSEFAERILPHVTFLAENVGSRLTLLRVTTPAELIMAQAALAGPSLRPMAPLAMPPLQPDPTPVVEAQRREALEYLERVAGRLQNRGITVDYEQLEGMPDEAISARAHQLEADLIAMTTHGRGGLGRLVFGSVAESVLRHAPCPILLVRIAEQDLTQTRGQP